MTARQNQDNICKGYQSGKSIKRLVEEYKSSYKTVRSILENNNIEIRRRGGVLSDEEKSIRLQNIKNYAIQHGGVCLENEYINNDTLMRFRCA